ncbi:pyridoxal-phosphate dependent enzyme [Streptomyces armeniacus]|uniref:Pyridoxal-phosphate dependent enzyme n=1 Tax=Streptomyces armeniacus TaxID=83291 RepID=A0A345XTC2_9ACTN|nr:pyridoxal-phosphate dependent enzyme [Streptomyces armeniacus]AXK34888.1 pyridoxal-phosphate dependent enzyme [Streptomyces armeniacus]
MHTHIAEAVKRPDLIALQPDLVCLRFETMKIYSALGAVRHLLDTGAVRRGDTLIDSSSGIYAQALALACHRYGMKCHIVGSTTVDRTLRVQLEILGATLEQVAPSKNLRLDQETRVRRIAEILAENPSYHWMRQYHDAIHRYGYRDVADTLDRELPAGPLALVGGVGSGASTGALADYLRAAGRDVTLTGVQPFGSVTFGSEHVSDPDMIIAGIGSAIEFENVRHESYDRIHWVNFDCALSGAVGLLRAGGIFAGLSTGAAYLTTLWERRRDASRTYVFIAADTGHRYVENAFAKHADAPDIDTLKPHEISSLHELRHPWSTTYWRGLNTPGNPGPSE